MKKYLQILTLVSLIILLNSVALPQVTVASNSASPESIALNRSRGMNMLDEIKDVIRDHYYDKKYHGIDLDERFKAAKEKIKKLDANWQVFRVIAQVLFEFDDSHTMFYPPNRANRVEYGFSMQMIGGTCFVTDVKKGSDAEAKGVKVGDEITGIESYVPSRSNLWVIRYLFYALDPLPAIKVQLKDLDGKERPVEIRAAFKSIKEREKEADEKRNKKEEAPYRCHKINGETITCKLDTFSVEKKHIDDMMKEISGSKKLIFDLRGNGGGLVSIEEYLVGHFFDRDIKVATFVTRNKSSERVAKTQKEKVFKGELIVLIDSDSASASEVFARVVQLEKRGKVIGDTSAGAVMTSNFVTMQNSRGVPGYETFSLYAINLTVADLIMSDGNRLEKVGVFPDQPALLTGRALRGNLDGVLAYAASLFGAELSPAQAGNLHFLLKKDDEEKGETKDK